MAHAARAGTPPDAVEQARAARAEFTALVQAARKQNDLPRLNDPAAAPVFARVWNVAALLGSGPYTSRDGSALAEVITLQELVLRTYGAFSLVSHQGEDVTKFQDEIAGSLRMVVASGAATLEAAGDAMWVIAGPNSDGGALRRMLPRVRTEMIEILAGINEAMMGPGLRDANKRLLAQTLGTYGPRLARGFTLPMRDRAALGGEATLAQADEADRAPLRAFVRAMQSRECERLCTLE